MVGPLAGAASAHERRTVGTLQFVVGWAAEPAYSGFLNAVSFTIRDASGARPVPVTDVGDALKVEVSFGAEKVGPMALESVFNSPGEYQAPLIPTRPGVYKFRFVGTVKGQPVDETFTSSDSTFDSPEDAAEIEFPVKDPSPAELSTRVERVDTRPRAAGEAADDAKRARPATAIGAAGLAAWRWSPSGWRPGRQGVQGLAGCPPPAAGHQGGGRRRPGGAGWSRWRGAGGPGPRCPAGIGPGRRCRRRPVPGQPHPQLHRGAGAGILFGEGPRRHRPLVRRGRAEAGGGGPGDALRASNRCPRASTR